MNFQEIEQILNVIQASQVAEVKLKTESYQLRVRNAINKQNHSRLLSGNVETSKISINSPWIGRVYLSADDTSELCIQIGQKVNQGDIVAYISCLGQLKPVVSEVSGVVSQILVKNGDAVDYGFSLIELD